jgi:hypothetical protein
MLTMNRPFPVTHIPPPPSEVVPQCSQSMPSNSFLGLPQELRDFIIEHAITVTTRAPSTLNKETATEEYDDLDYMSRVGGRGVFYPAKQYHTSPFALLLVNHQLYDETKAMLDRLSLSNGIKYSMDVILSDEEFLYPNWTYIPPLVQNVDSFAVNFRILGIGGNEKNGFMDEEGSTGSAVWRLYSVLERFLRCGASKPRNASDNRRLHLKQLAINVETPADVDKSLIAPEDIGPDHLPMYRRDHAPHNMVMNPTTLARLIYIWVEGILRLSDPSYALPTPIAKYSKMFFENIEDIGISVDGEEKFSIDVADMKRDIADRSSELPK